LTSLLLFFSPDLALACPFAAWSKSMPVCMHEAKPRAAKRACFCWGQQQGLAIAKEGKNKSRREVKFSHKGKN
jgi:hypothetical protein